MFYPNFNAELARKGWSLLKLSSETGIPYSTLRLKVKGATNFSIQEAHTIKQALGVTISLDELFFCPQEHEISVKI